MSDVAIIMGSDSDWPIMEEAALLAARILGISNDSISKKVSDALTALNTEAKAKGANLEARRNQKTGF